MPTKLAHALQLLCVLSDETDLKTDNNPLYHGLAVRDKLRDFIDYVEWATERDPKKKKSIQKRRAGLSSWSEYAVNRWQPRPDLKELIDAALGLSNADLQALLLTAQTLRSALMPVPNRKRLPDTQQPMARGTFQVKTVRKYRYLYFRYATTGGGIDKTQKRFKSRYLGLPELAAIVDETEPKSPERAALMEQMTIAYEQDGIDGLYKLIPTL